ncbi:glycosyltransferase family protein [Flammeovirgaceae bacterium SG7u.111]|nr:glycosyltransferase family protein [Flammeovirgaceae bacterium SG7u.132]WPO37357.1 glycosyltransferase family protein [Flammeovirgaceae bacterium SG7u.111]
MRILYAIQGTGNGHLSRARDIVPILQKKGELDLLVSGYQADVDLPFEVKYRCNGLSFIFGKSGGVDLLKTVTSVSPITLYGEIKEIPVEKYDLVINDFEPVSAWACKLKNIPCISLSHQCALFSPKTPKPQKFDPVGKAILSNYAPTTANYGFHFDTFDKQIYTPVIRQQIRELHPENKGHYTVYLPSYRDQTLVEKLGKFPAAKWEVFSKHNKKPLETGNVSIRPVNNDGFIKSMTTSMGVLCGAGFETPAEALFLEKKLMVIPMKNQYEQHCNAAALEQMGVPVLQSLAGVDGKIEEWLETSEGVRVNYPDITEQIIDELLQKHGK